MSDCEAAHDLRNVLDAVLYVARTGIPRRHLPHYYPHWNTGYGYVGKWERDGIFEQFDALLRSRVREDEGRRPEPTGSVIDAQSVKTATNVPAREQGSDVGKKIVGRKRSIVIDTTGLMLTVLVTAASIRDSVAGERLLNRLAHRWATRGPSRTRACALWRRNWAVRVRRMMVLPPPVPP